MSFWDNLGRFWPGQPPARPEKDQIYQATIVDRWTNYPSAGLTPARLALIMREADQGGLLQQSMLFWEMEEKDPHLASIMQTRKLTVAGLDWDVQAASEDAKDQEVAEFCREVVDTLNMRECLLHLLDAIGQGYAATEILWETGPQWKVAKLIDIPPRNITFINSITPLVMAEANNWVGEDAPPWKLIFHRNSGRSIFDFRNGVFRTICWMYLLKNYALKDWAVYNEVFGMPMRVGKYDPSASPADRDALVAAIRSLGSDAAGIICKTTDIEFVAGHVERSNQNPYQTLAEFCNREMSKAVLGQTLTTDTTGTTGTYAAGKVQEGVRQDILEADAQALGATLTRQLLAPLVGFNFGWETPVPQYVGVIAKEEDLKAASETYYNLWAMGFPISVQHISERFDVPLPQAGEETVSYTPPTDQKGGLPPRAPLKAVTDPGMELLAALRSEGRLGAFIDSLTAQPDLPAGPGDEQVVKRHAALEKQVQKALEAAQPLAERMLAPVKQLVESGASLTDIKQRLLAIYPHMPAEEMGQLIYELKMRAYMRGREEGAR